MFEEYILDIVYFLAILTFVVAFVIIRTRKNSDKKESLSDKKTQELESSIVTRIKTDEYDEKGGAFHDEERDLSLQIINQALEGKEEGTFGETLQAKEKAPTPLKEVKKNALNKRSVPPHGKITKEDFNEFSGARILVAEDNLINQKVIKGLLANTGIEIVVADDGQEALDILEKDSDFLLILMDAHMPRVDGFEATRAIRKNPKYDHVLVVALSGDTSLDDVNKMKAAGMSEHLEKPLKISDFYDIMYAYFEVNSKTNVIMTKELNGVKGLEICGGDEQFYIEILREFVAMYENSTDELGNLLKNGQLNQADKLLLDVIGVTANIGADSLNEIASDIKSAIAQATDKSYLNLVDAYKTKLDNLIMEIKSYYKR